MICIYVYSLLKGLCYEVLPVYTKYYDHFTSGQFSPRFMALSIYSHIQ